MNEIWPIVWQAALYTLVGWSVGAGLTALAAHLLKPLWKSWIKELRAHHAAVEAQQAVIADRLDTHTPGGLRTVLEEVQHDSRK